MAQIVFEAEPRSVTRKQNRVLRREGWVPGVVYGHKVEPIMIQMEEKALQRHLTAGAHGLVALSVKGEEKPRHVLVREVQRHPLNRHIVHMDLQEVAMTEKLRTSVPVTLVGVSPLVERGDGILLTNLTQVEIECLPAAIPEHISLDISGLKAIGEPITAGSLPLPEGVALVTDPGEMVVTVVRLAKEEEVEALVAEPTTAEPEVIHKGKEEEEA
ncbi:MAG: 50S ribosomal protein L25 [Chloroflexi bacterium]|nr:50S ribosomal protein L25 [Chloroflexota bacterium]